MNDKNYTVDFKRLPRYVQTQFAKEMLITLNQCGCRYDYYYNYDYKEFILCESHLNELISRKCKNWRLINFPFKDEPKGEFKDTEESLKMLYDFMTNIDQFNCFMSFSNNPIHEVTYLKLYKKLFIYYKDQFETLKSSIKTVNKIIND